MTTLKKVAWICPKKHCSCLVLLYDLDRDPGGDKCGHLGNEGARARDRRAHPGQHHHRLLPARPLLEKVSLTGSSALPGTVAAADGGWANQVGAGV